MGRTGSDRAAPHRVRYTGTLPRKPKLSVVNNDTLISKAVNEDKEFLLLRETFEMISVSFEENFRWVAEFCESPIERLMLLGLMADSQVGHPFRVEAFRSRESGDLQKVSIWEQSGLWLLPQINIGPYRADLVLVNNLLRPRQIIIIECDGHHFHEKTKEQAARDKQRDRYFFCEGYTVLHFTGSEIYRDARECAQQVLALVKPW